MRHTQRIYASDQALRVDRCVASVKFDGNPPLAGLTETIHLQALIAHFGTYFAIWMAISSVWCLASIADFDTMAA